MEEEKARQLAPLEQEEIEQLENFLEDENKGVGADAGGPLSNQTSNSKVPISVVDEFDMIDKRMSESSHKEANSKVISESDPATEVVVSFSDSKKSAVVQKLEQQFGWKRRITQKSENILGRKISMEEVKSRERQNSEELDALEAEIDNVDPSDDEEQQENINRAGAASQGSSSVNKKKRRKRKSSKNKKAANPSKDMSMFGDINKAKKRPVWTKDKLQESDSPRINANVQDQVLNVPVNSNFQNEYNRSKADSIMQERPDHSHRPNSKMSAIAYRTQQEAPYNEQQIPMTNDASQVSFVEKPGSSYGATGVIVLDDNQRVKAKISPKVKQTTQQKQKPKANMPHQAPFNNNKKTNNATAPPKNATIDKNDIENQELANQMTYKSEEIELGIVGSLGKIKGESRNEQDCRGNIDVSIQDTRDVREAKDSNNISATPMLIKDDVDQIDQESLNFDKQGPDTSRQDENELLIVPELVSGTNFASKDSARKRKSLYPANNNDDFEDSEDDIPIQKGLTLRKQKTVAYKESNQLKELMSQKMANRDKNLTITDLQKKLPKTGSYELRTEYMKKFIGELEDKHDGYFNGKKIPYSKNANYKQCILNPYTNDGSVITIQEMGRLKEQVVDEKYKKLDKLQKKMEFHEINAGYLHIDKFKLDHELFEAVPGDGFFHNFGSITPFENKNAKAKDKDYSIISFWQMTEDNEQRVHQPFILPLALSRVVNESNDLKECVFLSENINLPFIFSHKSNIDRRLILNLLGQPNIHLKQQSTKLEIKKQVSKQSVRNDQSIDINTNFMFGMNKIEIGRQSFLEKQILTYMTHKENANPHEHSCYSLRAPTIVQIDNEAFIVITKTVSSTEEPTSPKNKNHQQEKTSLCFVKVFDGHTYTVESQLQEDDEKEPIQISGDISYEIPGAEMFLGLDKNNQSVYYLTNKKYTDLDHKCNDPVEARLSSPPIVRMITINEIRALKELQEKIRLGQDVDDDQNPHEEIKKIISEVKTWNVIADKQTMDFFRCQSVDYPHVDGVLDDSLTKLCLNFTENKVRQSIALVFNLVEVSEEELKKQLDQQKTIKKKSKAEPDDNENSGEDKEVQDEEEQEMEIIEEKIEGYYMHKGERIQLEITGMLAIEHDEGSYAQEFEGKENLNKEVEIDLDVQDETWEPVVFDDWENLTPIKLKKVNLDPKTTVSFVRGIIDMNGMKFMMKTRDGFTAERECDPLGYPYEKSFDLMFEPDNASNQEPTIKAWMTGYVRHTVFSTRMIIVYHYTRTNLAEDKHSRRFIFERKTKAKLKIRNLDEEATVRENSQEENEKDGSKAKSFDVELRQGVVKDKGLLVLETPKQALEYSKIIGHAHKIIKTEEGELLVLHGSLAECAINLMKDQEQDFIQLLRVENIGKKGDQADNKGNDQNKEMKKDMVIPVKELVDKISQGGEFFDENGLLYTVRFKSEKDVQINSVGYEYEQGAPDVNFFRFNLSKEINEDSGEVIEHKPVIQSPIPQHFIAEFPLVAYKSFMLDDSEIVFCNVAQKLQAMQILQMVNWRFICFVGHAMLRELEDIDKHKCYILFIAQHTQLEKNRLFMIKLDPWVSAATRGSEYGTIDCFETCDFNLPNERLSELKKVDLLLKSDEQKIQMSLIMQYENSLWAVPLTTVNEAVKLLPNGDLQMMKRQTFRCKNFADSTNDSEYSIFVGAFSPESQNYSLLRVSLNEESPGEYNVDEVYKNENASVLAYEVDPQDNNHFYCLTDEQQLIYMRYDTLIGKCVIVDNYDLSVHNLEEVLEDFERSQKWASILVDDRTITIKNRTYSLATNFSWCIVNNEDEKKSYWRSNVGQREQRLLDSKPIPGTLHCLQVWMAGEYYFFRPKPMPGSAIIDVLGQMRTHEDCQLYLSGQDQQIMFHIEGQRLLTFDNEGYVKEKNLSLYKEPIKILKESPVFDDNKFLVIRRQMKDENDREGQISLVHERKNKEPCIIGEPFYFQDVEIELQQLGHDELVQLLGLKDPLSIAPVAQTIKVHQDLIILTKYGVLYLIASCVIENMDSSLSIFESSNKTDSKKKTKEDFVYESSQKVFGCYSSGNLNILIIACNKKEEQTALSSEQKIEIPDESQKSGSGVQIQSRRRIAQQKSLTLPDQSHVSSETRLLNFNFAMVGHKLLWVNFEQKMVWELDTRQMKDPPSEDDLDDLQRPQFQWSKYSCKYFLASSIFAGLSAIEFEETRVGIHEIPGYSTIRTRKIDEQHDQCLELVQFTALNNATVLNLTDQKPYVVELMHELDQFRYPLYFSSCGFIYRSKQQTMQFNEDQSLGFKRPLSVTKQRGLYRAFAEIDLKQLKKLKEIIEKVGKANLTKEIIGQIEPQTASCAYEQETFFSLFAEQGAIYEVFLNQIRQHDQEDSKRMLPEEEFDLFMRRLRYVITRPTQVFATKQGKEVGKMEDLVTRMSILKQCVLFDSQSSKVSMYKLADFFDFEITDYISSTQDLALVMQCLPSSQYLKMIDKFQSNSYTLKIQEAVMTKGVKLETFHGETPMAALGNVAFSLERDMQSNESIKKVTVRVIPLNWVYVNGGSLSHLFREFRSAQDKFQGSLLLDVMFDAFWGDFKWKIFFFCFLPYLIYFITAFVYITTMLFKPGEVAPAWGFLELDYMEVWEPPLHHIYLILLLFQIFIEINQIRDDGWSHFNQIQQVVDCTSLSLNLTVVICRYLMVEDKFEVDTLRRLGAVAGLFLWFQIVFWLRLFDGTAQYVALLLRTVQNIFSFMIVMLMIMFAFGTALYMLQINRMYKGVDENGLIFPYNVGDLLYYSTIINQYFIVLGDFSGMNLNDSTSEAGEILTTICFAATTFLSQITILNMLVAIMGETFAQHMEEQDTKSKQQKLLLLSEYIDIVEFYMNRICKCIKRQNPLYVFVITVEADDDDSDDGDDGAGAIQAVKRTVERKFAGLENMMNKKLVKKLQQLETDTRARLTALQQETKSKMQNVQNMIMTDTQKKLKVQDTQMQDMQEVLQSEIQTQMKKNKKDVVETINRQAKVIEDIHKMVKARW